MASEISRSFVVSEADIAIRAFEDVAARTTLGKGIEASSVKEKHDLLFAGKSLLHGIYKNGCKEGPLVTFALGALEVHQFDRGERSSMMTGWEVHTSNFSPLPR